MSKQGPPVTDGERMVWAAAYAASWAQLRAFQRSYGGDRSDANIASESADEAWGALDALRELSGDSGDFAADAIAVIGGAGLWCSDGKRAVFTRESSRCTMCGVEGWQHMTVPPCAREVAK